MQEKVGHTHLDDITRIVEGTRSRWKEQKNPKLFFTGGTGFVGGWMLRSFLEANRRLGLNGSATVLTRDVSRLKTAFPDVVGDAAVTWLEGDVRSFSFPKAEFAHIVNAAKPASAGGRGLPGLAAVALAPEALGRRGPGAPAARAV